MVKSPFRKHPAAKTYTISLLDLLNRISWRLLVLFVLYIIFFGEGGWGGGLNMGVAPAQDRSICT
jgi:hypothetical protein